MNLKFKVGDKIQLSIIKGQFIILEVFIKEKDVKVQEVGGTLRLFTIDFLNKFGRL